MTDEFCDRDVQDEIPRAYDKYDYPTREALVVVLDSITRVRRYLDAIAAEITAGTYDRAKAEADYDHMIYTEDNVEGAIRELSEASWSAPTDADGAH